MAFFPTILSHSGFDDFRRVSRSAHVQSVAEGQISLSPPERQVHRVQIQSSSLSSPSFSALNGNFAGLELSHLPLLASKVEGVERIES